MEKEDLYSQAASLCCVSLYKARYQMPQCIATKHILLNADHRAKGSQIIAIQSDTRLDNILFPYNTIGEMRTFNQIGHVILAPQTSMREALL